jgi:hypothetical protein
MLRLIPLRLGLSAVATSGHGPDFSQGVNGPAIVGVAFEINALRRFKTSWAIKQSQ